MMGDGALTSIVCVLVLKLAKSGMSSTPPDCSIGNPPAKAVNCVSGSNGLPRNPPTSTNTQRDKLHQQTKLLLNSLSLSHTHTQERSFNQLLPTPSRLSAPSARGQQTISSSREKQIAKRRGINKDGDKHPQFNQQTDSESQTRNSQDHQG
jgi:hypothetical protein